MYANERQYLLPIRLHSQFLYSRLVQLPDDLEGQHDVADLPGFAVPDQLHLALFLEQQKAVLLRQRFIRFQVADNFLLLLFGQSWHRFTLVSPSDGICIQ